ncbi:MAG TPA: peptide deformylase [Bacteroidales bacterium]|nr:peptide deformylase [Bacteroidales bacterium]HSA43800.1 peptide deformylase [Bacteroidales bacterium]
MILPIVSYGNAILKSRARDITADYPGLQALISDMFETMQSASGVGLAAPQVNLGIRLFVVDATPFADEDPRAKNFQKVFINPRITERSGEDVLYEEGCLSFPGIREEVSRKSSIRITYQDAQFQSHDEVYDGIIARIIQHEYDHIEGLLIVDHLSSLRKMLLKRRLKELTLGQVKVAYRMIFPGQRRQAATAN